MLFSDLAKIDAETFPVTSAPTADRHKIISATGRPRYATGSKSRTPVPFSTNASEKQHTSEVSNKMMSIRKPGGSDSEVGNKVTVDKPGASATVDQLGGDNLEVSNKATVGKPGASATVGLLGGDNSEVSNKATIGKVAAVGKPSISEAEKETTQSPFDRSDDYDDKTGTSRDDDGYNKPVDGQQRQSIPNIETSKGDKTNKGKNSSGMSVLAIIIHYHC